MHCKRRGSESPLFWRFSGGFWFSQDHLFSKNSTGKPLNLIKSPIFTSTPFESSFLYKAPSMHTVEFYRNCHHIQRHVLARPSVTFKVSFKQFYVYRGVPSELPFAPARNDTCAVTPCTAIQGQNKCCFSEEPLGTPLWAMEFLFFRAKGTRQKMTTQRWHLNSLDMCSTLWHEIIADKYSKNRFS